MDCIQTHDTREYFQNGLEGLEWYGIDGSNFRKEIYQSIRHLEMSLLHLFSSSKECFHLEREFVSNKLNILSTRDLLYLLQFLSRDRYPNIPSLNSLLIGGLFINPQSIHNISMSVISQTLCNTLWNYCLFFSYVGRKRYNIRN